MVDTHKSLSCAGLEPHESEAVRMVPYSLSDRLDTDWHFTGRLEEADVILVDPKTARGRALLEKMPQETEVITLLDRNVADLPVTHHYLFRPLRPTVLVRLLNELVETVSTDSGPASSRADPIASQAIPTYKPVSQAIREAMAQGLEDSIPIIDLGNGELAIDVERDRLRGSVDQLAPELLTDPTSYATYLLPTELARERSSSDTEMPLTLGLWKLLANVPAGQGIYGDPRVTAVRLQRWPRLPAKKIARVHRRAASLLRYRPHTATELADQTGSALADIVALCNGAWLTGDLEITERSASRSTLSSANHQAVPASLFSRIRERLGVA